VALADVYAAAFDLWHAGKRREAFDMFGRILAYNSLGSAGRESVLIARGVFKPTVRSRNAPPAAGVDVATRAWRRTPARWSASRRQGSPRRSEQLPAAVPQSVARMFSY